MEVERPKLKILLTPLDKVVEVLCWVGLAFTWVWAIIAYITLPEIVPIHFDLSGQPDGYGSLIPVLFLPLIPSVFAYGLTVLNRYPHTFNYLEEITPANAERNYRMGTRLLRWLKLFLVIIFAILLLLITNSANQNLKGEEIIGSVNLLIAGVLLMPLVVLLIVYLQYRKNKTSHA